MVMQTINPHTWEAEVGRSLIPGPAWFTKRVSEESALYREDFSQNQSTKKTKKQYSYKGKPRRQFGIAIEMQ